MQLTVTYRNVDMYIYIYIYEKLCCRYLQFIQYLLFIFSVTRIGSGRMSFISVPVKFLYTWKGNVSWD